MGSDLFSEICFTCCNKPANFHTVSDSDEDLRLNIYNIICQHFWFREDDLRSAIVCETCWEKVDHFHQFYLEVKKLHEHREMAPLSMYIKQEEITIEETQLQENCIDVSAEDQELFDKTDCKHEIKEECNELSLNEELAEVYPHPRKKRKYSRLPNKRVVKRKNPHSRKPLKPEQQQAEDDFIKQHNSYICDECNIEFENFRAIKKHRMKTHKNDTVVCCGTQHRIGAKLYQHVQNFLNLEACKIKNSYVRHKTANHADKKEPVFKCHRCPKKSFTKECILKIHMAEHETLENGTAKCEFCGKCFRSKKILNAHVKTVHKVAEQPRKQCPVCNKWLKTHEYWLKHMRRHDEGEYKCEVCGHVSINLMSLKEHMKRKHGPNNKPHVCELCGKGYSRATTLKEHIASAHTREHLYQCQYCEKKFFSSANMYSHRKKDHPQKWLEDHMSKYAKREESSAGNIDGEAVS